MKNKVKKILDKLNILNFCKKILFNYNLNKQYNLDKKNYKEYMINENCNVSKLNVENIKYYILYLCHSIEKGMLNNNPRPFGIKKINIIIDLLNSMDEKYYDSYEYILGNSCLNSYLKFYEVNNWENRNEYLYVKKYLSNKNINYLDFGVKSINKKDIFNEYNFDKLLIDRHSTREFLNKKIEKSDFINICDMIINTPSACNRQMCKIYYINDEEKKDEVLKIGQGFGNFQKDTANIFIITYDRFANLSVGERNQGMFNAGLISMNFVNALHSKGIGSCFVQFGNSYNQENKLKEKLNIPKNEKIAVIVAAGYYKNIFNITLSTRKKLDCFSKII